MIQRGFSIVEVLIAVVIMSIVVLAVVQSLTHQVRFSQREEKKSLARQETKTLVSRITKTFKERMVPRGAEVGVAIPISLLPSAGFAAGAGCFDLRLAMRNVAANTWNYLIYQTACDATGANCSVTARPLAQDGVTVTAPGETYPRLTSSLSSLSACFQRRPAAGPLREVVVELRGNIPAGTQSEPLHVVVSLPVVETSPGLEYLPPN